MLAYKDLLDSVISMVFYGIRTGICMYHLAAARQAHDAVLLFIVLLEGGIEGLEDIWVGKGLDIYVLLDGRQSNGSFVRIYTGYDIGKLEQKVSTRQPDAKRRLLPTSPGGADSTKEATVACLDDIFLKQQQCV